MSEKPVTPDSLRTEAEAELAHARPIDAYTRSAEELLHELQVHQIELEMQNENLRQSMLTLEESRDRYVDFYDFAPVGYLTLSREGLITEINLTAAVLLGNERSKLINRRFASFVTPEDSDLWYRHFMAVLQHDNQQSCELNIQPNPGVLLRVQLGSLRLVKNAKAPVVRIAMTDITRLTMAEIALHDSETNLRILEQREILQASLDGFLAMNTADGRILDANDAYCHMVGYAQPELLGMRIYDLDAHESPEETAHRIQNIIELGYDRFETRHRHRHGHLIHVEINVSHSELDDGVNYAFIRDITKRKHAEELLRNAYEEVKDLYNNAPCGYHSLDENGIICRINTTELSYLGYTRDEIVGKMRLPDLMPPASKQAFLASFPQLKSNGFVHGLEVDLIRKDGTILHGLINATAIYDPSGNFVMSRSSLTDISKLAQVEQQLHDLTAHIQSVREDEKTYLAREIHDEFGGTLSALKIEASQLKRALPDNEKITRRIDSMAEMIDSAMTFMRRIITDLRPSILDDLGLMAALEWQADEFHKRTAIECRVVCTSYNDSCRKPCKDCMHKLNKTLSINLFRIFQEALTNVARHSGASRVEVEYCPDANEVFLSISDNGCGLAEGHAIAQTSFGIRGIHERVEQLGGKINFDRPAGGGLTLSVQFPLM